MNQNEFFKYYDFNGRTAVVTGGGGVLCSEMVIALAHLGANVAVLGRKPELPERILQAVETAPGKVILVQSDVLDKKVLEGSAKEIIAKLGRVDTLINGAGGNKPAASTSAEMSFFDLPKEALDSVFDLNLLGTILPCQVFGREMAEQKKASSLISRP